MLDIIASILGIINIIIWICIRIDEGTVSIKNMFIEKENKL
jgi:hypothetical protein